MELLTWVTVIYAVVLVLTLAVGLITILVTLRSVAKSLGHNPLAHGMVHFCKVGFHVMG